MVFTKLLLYIYGTSILLLIVLSKILGNLGYYDKENIKIICIYIFINIIIITI